MQNGFSSFSIICFFDWFGTSYILECGVLEMPLLLLVSLAVKAEWRSTLCNKNF